MHGADPALYLATGYDLPAHRDVLTALGVEGNPTVAALIDKLTEIRQAHVAGRSLTPDVVPDMPMSTDDAADLAAPFYQALAAEVHGGATQRVGNMQASVLRNQFDRGDGLIITNLGWRRTVVARSGPPIFGDLVPFVPAVKGTDLLWTALGVRRPTADDAKAVIRKLAGTRALDTDERQIMLEALRVLARTPSERLGQLRRQPVYLGSGWSSKRPVYAVENPLLAEALHASVPVWQPGGQLTQLRPLIEPLALTVIDGADAHVLQESSANYDVDLTETFRHAVRNLQTDLAQSAPTTAEAIVLTWEELADFQVAVLPDLRVQVSLPGTAGQQVALPAWLAPDRATLYVRSPEDASRARSGGYAIASSFEASPREVAHAWLAAWADAQAGRQAELVVSAAARAAEATLRREKSQAALTSLPTSKPDGARPAHRLKKATAGRGASDSHQPPQKARTLVDPATLVLQEATGAFVVGEPRSKGSSTGAAGTAGSGGSAPLRDPKPDQPKKPGVGGRGPLNFTPFERESAGLNLLRIVLASDECTVTDVRHQPNVGADAVDDRGRYYELKVHQGAIPDTVKLEDSQVQRAMAAPDDFFLVLVGNVEEGQGNPEVRIIHDPLHHLTVQPQGAVHLTGVLSAEVARSWTFEPLVEDGDDAAPESD